MPVRKMVDVAELDAGQVVRSAQVSPAEFFASSRRRVTASSSCNRSQTARALTRIGFGMLPSRTSGSAPAVRMVREGQSLRAVAHHYHVGHSTIVRALERTLPEAGTSLART